MEAFISMQAVDVLKAAYTEMLNGCLSHPDQWEWYAIWMIELKDGTHIGELCFKGITDEGSAEIGYGIAEEYQGHGYATEAVSALTDWAMEQPGIAYVTAEAEENNLASQRVLAKAGFVPTGETGEEGVLFIRKKQGKTNPKIRHISFGTGKKTMVIVPGLSIGYVTDYAQAIENAFSAFVDDYTVYLFDVRDDVPENYTVRDMGEDLVTAIKGLDLDHVYLYGCSMGGMESMYVAGEYPELVEKIVVAASACKSNDTSDAVIGNWIRLAAAGRYHELTENMGKLINSQRVYEASSKAYSAMADGLSSESAHRFINIANAIPKMDISETAAKINCPILILGSKGDKVLTAEASAVIAEITGGELYLYGAEYPHAVYDEAPDLRDRVKAFFD